MNERSGHPTDLLREVAAEGLSPAEREHLEEHIEDCTLCRREYRTLRSIVELLDGYDPEPPSPNRLDRIETYVLSQLPDSPENAHPSRTIEPEATAGRLQHSVRWGMRVAAAIVLLATGALLGRYAGWMDAEEAAPTREVEPMDASERGIPNQSSPSSDPDTSRAKSQVDAPEPFHPIQSPPVLIGGIGSIQERLEYPERAIRYDVEGVVVIKFTVNAKGRVVDARVVPGTSLGYGCDTAAIKALRSARFEPASQLGDPVAVDMTIPVRFELTR